MLVDPDRHVPDNVVADSHLALHFRHRVRRSVNIQQGEMGLAVFLDPVGERLETPILGLLDRPAALLSATLRTGP